MNKSWPVARTIVWISLSLAAHAHAQPMPLGVAVSNPRVYEVTITTTFRVPAGATQSSQLRVWHALPTARPWSGLRGTLGASAITYRPENGHVLHLASNESQSVFWEFREGLTAGKTLELVSRFRVRSVDRTFDPKSSSARWSDYGVDYSPNQRAPVPVGDELAAIVDGIKRSRQPAEVARELSQWISQNIKYDATVPHFPGDVATTRRLRKGHCGHQMALFEAMCARAGIPTRLVAGLNLYAPGGVGALHKIRPDFENQHTWAQVYLPGFGWIEIDPGAGANAYSIPAQLIQNSTDFQNYVIWICENGIWKQPEWDYREGTFSSPYGVENRRTFRTVELKQDEMNGEGSTESGSGSAHRGPP
jgi:transglutaminase-like putative cysteine protease